MMEGRRVSGQTEPDDDDDVQIQRQQEPPHVQPQTPAKGHEDNDHDKMQEDRIVVTTDGPEEPEEPEEPNQNKDLRNFRPPDFATGAKPGCGRSWICANRAWTGSSSAGQIERSVKALRAKYWRLMGEDSHRSEKNASLVIAMPLRRNTRHLIRTTLLLPALRLTLPPTTLLRPLLTTPLPLLKPNNLNPRSNIPPRRPRIRTNLLRPPHNLLHILLTQPLHPDLQINPQSHIKLLHIPHQVHSRLHNTILGLPRHRHPQTRRRRIHRALETRAVPRGEQLLRVRLSLIPRSAEGFRHGQVHAQVVALDVARSGADDFGVG
ncbi:hypothetical protein CSAL01_13684 [Colletotrichum salicis]|uniref:Uncharacterized protein n=1 Tax=Colletotrichum salicis TaxID=1209931 RepID=A0A135RSQ6_9PEZI|nr:hypothetical protein CSAL01_13684 [Colletotrichum salicis]